MRRTELLTFTGSVGLVFLALIVTMPQSLLAQPGTATLRGCTKRQQARPAVGANVKVISAAGVSRSAVTDATGCFNLPNLPIGSYSVEAMMPGFTTARLGVVLGATTPELTIQMRQPTIPGGPPGVHGRPFLIPPAPARPADTLYNIAVTLRALDVIDDCDNVSDGEWRIFLDAGTNDLDAIVVPDGWQYWPSVSSNAEVATGEHYNPNLVFKFYHVAANETIALRLNGVDCDGSTLLGPALQALNNALFFGALPVGGLIDTGCGEDEDFPEESGAHDWLGNTALVLSPQQWKDGPPYWIAWGPQNSACGDGSAYRASFEVWKRRIEHP